ncbi:hypothetical protein [Oceanicoccus sagamiensis]|uniref:Phosphate ABC transporter substrate-binding protein n=1 Tax=Oceanicoccus sagamiensis TaxID=716816 RepID=A0A1X9NJW3_9GAMM|nr:hypothetical protein [Oceanicoccus sagamiensis]ARN74263.1 hypothetical protein BST96_09100 [Oceanicoccus sagamiensis]
MMAINERNKIAATLLAILWLIAPRLHADIAVVVHPDAKIETISPAYVVNIFLGKVKTLPNGQIVIPIDQSRESEARLTFYKKLANKNQNQLNAYWARQVFTGKGQPPSQVANSESIKLLISDNPSMIGYMDSKTLDSSVKAILLIP